MAELIKKAYFKNKSGIVQSAKLYTTLDEVQGQGVSVNTMSDNLIPVENRKFEGWVAYQGAVVTVTQDIPMPEWGTTEATRIQTSGGSSATKFLYRAGIGNSKTFYYKSVYVKNTGTTSFSVHGNNITSKPLVVNPGESVKAIREGFGVNNTLQNSLEFTSNIGEGINMIVYQPVIKQTIQAYMKYGEVGDANATAARIKRYENLIPLEKRKFEGWNSYQGSVVTLTQNVSVPEWQTSEATRIQTTGGTSLSKFYFGNFPVPPIGAKCALRCMVKNQGIRSMAVVTNMGDKATIGVGESKAVFINSVGDGKKTFLFVFFTESQTDSIDVLAYKPELYYIDDLNKDWAILSQAEIPYGSQLYTTTGVFTIPAGISKLRVTAKGAGGGGGGSLWNIDDWEYLINSGGSGGRGGLNIQTITVTSGAQHPVTVGRGGMGGSNDRNSPAGSGAGGGASSFLTVSATGGGGGGGGSYESSGSSGTNGSPAGAGANGGGGSGSARDGDGGSGANGSVLIEWGGDIS